mmetsp:Transcript_3065/g.4601  ORF Transcript_3065/g.4601 Transcript_3065/m.4601 type:complete len:89 (-) Transcript_3065:441-707(-)
MATGVSLSDISCFSRGSLEGFDGDGGVEGNVFIALCLHRYRASNPMITKYPPAKAANAMPMAAAELTLEDDSLTLGGICDGDGVTGAS